MKRVLDGIEPLKVFFYFEEICNIPHVSHHTSEMSDYIENFAKRKGFKYDPDEGYSNGTLNLLDISSDN